jgi:hypothetical protein
MSTSTILSLLAILNQMQTDLDHYKQSLPVKEPVVVEHKIPLPLQRVAFCESGNAHYDKYGRVIRGRVDHDDIGRFQINQRYHGTAAAKLGFDLFSPIGNTQYAMYLYEREGLKPWNASRSCWGSKIASL